MVRKNGQNGYMTGGEKIGGTVFFVIYLLVLPFATAPILALVGKLLGMTISQGLGNTIYYYVLFVATIVVFHQFIWRTTTLFVENLGQSAKLLAVGFVAFYGLNELIYRLTAGLLRLPITNLNDVTISAQMSAAPYSTALIVVLLAPFVEEVLFRGLVFGGIKSRSPALAYIVSCVLFALLHVWQFALVNQDITYLVLAIQYLVPGILLAWVFDQSGTLWTPILLHMGINALSVWCILA